MTIADEVAGFDWEAAKNGHSTTPERERKRCRECKSSNIVRKTHRREDADHRKPGKYRCEDPECQAHFDEPVTGLTAEEAGRDSDLGPNENWKTLPRDEHGNFMERGEEA